MYIMGLWVDLTAYDWLFILFTNYTRAMMIFSIHTTNYSFATILPLKIVGNHLVVE